MKQVMDEIKLPYMDADLVSREIGDFVVDTAVGMGKSGAVIGLSGGVDSTVTAGLIKKAFDSYNTEHGTNLELVGYVLPSKINNPQDTEDGIRVAETLGIRYETHSIEGIAKSYGVTNPEALESKFHNGNLLSRIRANVLNTKSATENKVLSGTGNKDEDFGIGFYTLFGDGAVHMSPISGLSKRLVREMADYLGFPDIAKKVPTPGLEPGQTDFKDLGYRYDVVELLSEGLSQGFTKEELVVHPQIVNIVDEQMKVYESLYGEPKFDTVDSLVLDFLRRHHIAKKKFEIISPPSPTITLNY